MGHVRHIELKKMVAFFYNLDYDNDLPEEADMSLLQLHVRMFALADQYDIPGLSVLAADKYSSRCVVTWRPMEVLTSIPDVYGTTPLYIRQLRDTACTAIREHLPRMLQDKDVEETYEMILAEIPEFTKDLLRSYVSNPLYGDCQWCGSCQPMEALQGRCKKCKKGNSGFGLYHS